MHVVSSSVTHLRGRVSGFGCLPFFLLCMPARCVQAKKSKQVKPPTTAVAKSARDNTVVKPETQRAEKSNPSSEWKNSVKHRQRQDAPRLAVDAVSAKTSNGVDTGSRGRGRGGRGPSRGGGKVKQAKPTAGADAGAVIRSPQGERESESVTEVTTPVPQAAAERKEGQSPDLSSSVRKSPRSKEVREKGSCARGHGMSPMWYRFRGGLSRRCRKLTFTALSLIRIAGPCVKFVLSNFRIQSVCFFVLRKVCLPYAA